MAKSAYSDIFPGYKKNNGTNTIIVASVDEKIGLCILWTDWVKADSSRPVLTLVLIVSTTISVLFTHIPIPTIRPERLIMFKLFEKTFRTNAVAAQQSGIVRTQKNA